MSARAWRHSCESLTSIGRAPVTKENVEALLLGDLAYLAVFIPFVNTYGKWIWVRLAPSRCIRRSLAQGSWFSVGSLAVLITARLVFLYVEYTPSAGQRHASPPTTTTPTKRGRPRSPRRT